MSDWIFVQIIPCKKIFPTNKIQVHLWSLVSPIPRKFGSHITWKHWAKVTFTLLTLVRFWLACSTVSTVQHSTAQYMQLMFRGRKSLSTETAKMSRNVWETSLQWLLFMTYISVCMDCLDHARWPTPPPPHTLLLIHRAAADVVFEPCGDVNHHPVICETRGLGITGYTEFLTQRCSKQSGSIDRDTAWRNNTSHNHIQVHFSSLAGHARFSPLLGCKMSDKFLQNLFQSCDSTSEAFCWTWWLWKTLH